jgi:hypothetical protein
MISAPFSILRWQEYKSKNMRGCDVPWPLLAIAFACHIAGGLIGLFGSYSIFSSIMDHHDGQIMALDNLSGDVEDCVDSAW